MSTPSTSLVTLLAALTATRTPADAAAAAGPLYEAVRPVFIPVCEAVLRRAPGAPWLTAEDLAQDILVDALPALQRGACPHPTDNDLVRWLRTVAARRLISAARAQTGVSPTDITAVVHAVHAANAMAADVEDPHTQRLAAIRAVHDAALDELPLPLATTWRVVVEQGLPKTHAATELGIDPSTVHRHINAVRARLATRLRGFTP